MEIITGLISIKFLLKCKRLLFEKQYFGSIRECTLKTVQKVLGCGTESKGYLAYHCNTCSYVKRLYFTCKSRFCSSCGKALSDLWLKKLLSWRPAGLEYYHLAFTIPEELRDFFKRHRDTLSLLPQVATQAIFYYYTTNQKAKPGIVSVIHTFGAKLNRNPHVHLIITAGGINSKGKYKAVHYIPYALILSSRKKYLIKHLKERCYNHLSGDKRDSEIKLLNQLYAQKNDQHNEKSRYIYFSRKAESFQKVLSYIGRYLKRPIISQSRILSYDGETVVFNYKDKYDNQVKEISVSDIEFLGLLIQHIPNTSFPMIHYHGIFANRCKKKYLALLAFYIRYTSKAHKIPINYFERILLLTGINHLLCSCGGTLYKHSRIIPGYPTKYFHDP